jgi:hypothetical protein
MNSKGIGTLQASWGNHCSNIVSRIHVGGVYVQLISNSNIIRNFKQHDYIITLLITAEVKEPVLYRIECDILAKGKIQHNITSTSV